MGERRAWLVAGAVLVVLFAIAIALSVPAQVCVYPIGDGVGYQAVTPDCHSQLWLRLLIVGVGLILGVVLMALSAPKVPGKVQVDRLAE